MFNFSFGRHKDLVLISLVGLGLYSQCHQIDLANNTTILLILFLLIMEESEIEELKYEKKVDENCGPRACYRVKAPAPIFDGFRDDCCSCGCGGHQHRCC